MASRDFAEYIRAKLKADPDLAAAVEAEAFEADVAQAIYDARTQAGLTQKQLAERINSHQSVVARMEDADYGGHSLSMLKRIAQALGKQLRIEFTDATPITEPPKRSRPGTKSVRGTRKK
jgi:ribosome-binding protein aMBF1 (putative translation factor)